MYKPRVINGAYDITTEQYKKLENKYYKKFSNFLSSLYFKEEQDELNKFSFYEEFKFKEKIKYWINCVFNRKKSKYVVKNLEKELNKMFENTEEEMIEAKTRFPKE